MSVVVLGSSEVRSPSAYYGGGNANILQRPQHLSMWHPHAESVGDVMDKLHCSFATLVVGQQVGRQCNGC